MTTIAALPNWDGIHPAMVQFPVALLLAAPLLLLASLFARQQWRAWAGSALVLMVLGTLAAWFAVGSGHAAGQLVDKVPGLDRAIAGHEALGMATRTWFTLLTVVWGLFVLLPTVFKKTLPASVRIGVHAVFLICYLVATGVLVKTSTRGGLLVHKYGVRAMVEQQRRPETAPVASQTSPPRARMEKENAAR